MKCEIQFYRRNPEMLLVWAAYIWFALSAVAAPPLFRAAIVEDYTDPEAPAQKLQELNLKTKTSSMV